MDHDVIQHFEAPVAGRDGERYVAALLARPRPDRRWEAAIEFRRIRDGARFVTGIETTQPDRQAVLYWATGLGEAYFDGALDRALRPRTPEAAWPPGPPLIDHGVDYASHAQRRYTIAADILDHIRSRGEPRFLTQELFGRLPYANADVVRALEFLEKEERLLVRRTEEGNDWLFLTEAGLRAAGLDGPPHIHDRALIDRRKSR